MKIPFSKCLGNYINHADGRISIKYTELMFVHYYRIAIELSHKMSNLTRCQ